MDINIIFPPDPDCPKCGGSGGYREHDEDTGFGYLALCGCRGHENVAKVQARCPHEFACRKCGVTEVKRIEGGAS